MATQVGVGHQRSLYADEFWFFVQQWRQLIDVELASAAAVVEPVVPALHVVRSHRPLVGRPGMRWPQSAVQPCAAHVSDDFLDVVVYGGPQIAHESCECSRDVLRREQW